MSETIKSNVNTYYLNNREKLIKQSLSSYYKKIENMNKDELNEYRRLKSIYFKDWFEKNKERIHEKNRSRYICKPKKSDSIRPRRTKYKKIENEDFDNCCSFRFTE